MKTFYNVACTLFTVLFLFTACGNDDADYSAGQLEYISKNMEYIWEKKKIKNEQGNLLYKQLILGKDTVLYQILQKEGTDTSHPADDSKVCIPNLKGSTIDFVFMDPQKCDLVPKEVIPGLRYVLPHLSAGETVEVIIPAPLGYGYYDHGPIPAGSTLIFDFTIEKIE